MVAAGLAVRGLARLVERGPLPLVVVGVIAFALIHAGTPSCAGRRHGEPWRPMIVIDAASPMPPYEQLRAQLARQIQDRTLAVGTRLPTIRRLAADLGLAVNTVGRAYRELEEAGLIETRGRAGSFVSAAGEQAASGPAAPPSSTRP